MLPTRIAIVCMNPWDAPGSFQPFSYAAYRIQAALVGAVGLGAMDVEVFDRRGLDVDGWLGVLEEFTPHVIGVSAYLWSMPTFLEVARQFKDKYPETLIVFGGPSARPDMLSLPPHRHSAGVIDALVIHDGEVTIQRIIGLVQKGKPDAIRGLPGVCVSDGRKWLAPTPVEPIPDLNCIASPFQLDLVPQERSGHLETFRGCPMSCLFCQWGVLGPGSAVFSKDYLVAELEAFKRNKATGVYLVDAGLNLNARAFRNLMEADNEVGFLKDRELVCEVYPTLLRDHHLEFLSRTKSTVGLGLQSLDPELLKLHQRPFRIDRFEGVVGQLSKVAKTTVEVICGLPGDNPERFKDTVRAALDLPCSMRVYHCLVLPDALMTSAPTSFEMDYDPVTLEMRSCLGWSARDFMEVHDWLSQLAEDQSGQYTQKWPLPSEPGVVDHDVGKMVGSPLWMFPNHEHEEFHRSFGDGRKLDNVKTSIDVSTIGSVSQEDERIFAEALAEATGGMWVLETARIHQQRLLLHVLTAHGTISLVARTHIPSKPCYISINGVDFLYSTDDSIQMDNELLGRAFQRISRLDESVLDLIPRVGSAK